MARQPKKPKPPAFDPVATLREIAADPDAGSTARVQACRALLAYERDAAKAEPGDDTPRDAVTRRALRLVNGGKP